MHFDDPEGPSEAQGFADEGEWQEDGAEEVAWDMSQLHQPESEAEISEPQAPAIMQAGSARSSS